MPTTSDWRQNPSFTHGSPLKLLTTGATEGGDYIAFQGVPKDEVKRIIKALEKKMDIAARSLQFEQAAELRDQIEELRKIK